MKEVPMLFSGELVRAIIDGRKTQTRRIVKDQDLVEDTGGGQGFLHHAKCPSFCDYACRARNLCDPGDVIWVRETWSDYYEDTVFRADYNELPEEGFEGQSAWEARNHDGSFICDINFRWRPSIHMPRWAARLFLRVKDVRVERLQSISEADAMAEGVEPGRFLGLGSIGNKTYREGFVAKWRDIYGGDSWGENPWVWAITFERIENHKAEVQHG